MTDIQKLCVHTITTKPWSLEEALDHYSEKGVTGISVWENAIKELGASKAGQLIKSYPIDVVSYVRGGFFPSRSQSKREAAIEHNKKLLEEAAAIDAGLLVLVVGADPDQSLKKSRSQIQKGIEAILPLAKSLNVKLAIEPLHPMYAHSRSAINTLKQANHMAEEMDDSHVGCAIDVYHVWWEEDLKAQIMRCGKQDNLFAFHICDWKMPMDDMLNDRGLMGEGCINIKKIRKWVEEAGFKGHHEVEIFSNKYWSMDQEKFLDQILNSYLNHC